MAEQKLPFTKPDPHMIKVVLRNLRDQLKDRGSEKSVARPSPKNRG